MFAPAKYIFLGAVIFAACACVVIATRVEVLNHITGGGIERKARQEPDSKWRSGEGFNEAYRKVEQQLQQEKRSPGDEAFNASLHDEILRKVGTSGWAPTPADQLAQILRTWGPWHYPLSISLLLAFFFTMLFPPLRAGFSKKIWFGVGAIGGACLLLAIWRGY